MKLLIVESPAKAKTIEKYLDNELSYTFKEEECVSCLNYNTRIKKYLSNQINGII